jgi:hypothetical protein
MNKLCDIIGSPLSGSVQKDHQWVTLIWIDILGL